MGLLALAWILPVASAAKPTVDDAKRQLRSATRVVAALAEARPRIEQAFAKVDIPYPPAALLLRAFKSERVLELWAAPSVDAAYVLVRSYTVCAASGGLGPKRQQGDMQVPEGFYRIDRFNPTSQFHLSLGLDYPNASDRRHSDKQNPGGDIFIHGDCVTIGCLPIEDEIKALYVIVLETYVHTGGRDVPVFIYPRRLGSEAAMSELHALAVQADPSNALLWPFWQSLLPIDAAFERTHRLPRLRLDEKTGFFELVGDAGP